MKKVVALLMASIITVSTPMATVHAASSGERNLEDELISSGNENELNGESSEQAGEDDLIGASLWANKDATGRGHSTFAPYVMEYFSNHSSKNQALIQKCLLFGSENADNALLHNKEVDKVQLHGFKNYILSLNALWLYARKISISNQTDANCRAQIVNELPMKNQNERRDIDILLQTIPEIYKLYKQKNGNNPTNFEKQYLVLGLALHLIGDIYAHRTVLTLQLYKQAIKDGTMKKSDFSKRYDEFITKVRNGEIHCSNIDVYMNNPGNNMLYEDNTAFLPNRYKYSRASAKKFISNYVRNGSIFQADYLKRNAADGITLDKFDSYR
ncbi:hypothetical protein [Butyrivibrio sp. AE3004]|uniref:hypothetical protein n=1 Tax=Butyrivibrio sp. AE3004 TaxID=1506994 RepID=UPI000494AB9D|nr:hypothetical protein [Butyrivibrio sp. AE3004]